MEVMGEYSVLHDQCYYYQKRVYLYRLCMFNDVQQISNSRDRVIIGYFNSWSGETNNKYLQMKYSNGDICSNGQSRSLTVTFRCGVENRIVDVQEPTKRVRVTSSPFIVSY
jgi:hypothetical protein